MSARASHQEPTRDIGQLGLSASSAESYSSKASLDTKAVSTLHFTSFQSAPRPMHKGEHPFGSARMGGQSHLFSLILERKHLRPSCCGLLLLQGITVPQEICFMCKHKLPRRRIFWLVQWTLVIHWSWFSLPVAVEITMLHGMIVHLAVLIFLAPLNEPSHP